MVHRYPLPSPSCAGALLLALLALVLAGCASLPGPGSGGAGADRRASGGIRVIESDDQLQALRREAAGRGSAVDGGALGYFLDVQTARLQALARAGVSVQRRDDHILMIMAEAESFATDSDALQPAVEALLDDLAEILLEYRDSLVFIGGHSDSRGDPAYNLDLSTRRALAVGSYLAAAGIARDRLVAAGFGDQRPIAGNDSEQGRSRNRRVEIQLWPVTVGQATTH